MNSDFLRDPIIVNVLMAILGSLIASFLALQLGFRQYRKQAWHQRKMDAYDTLLSIMNEYALRFEAVLKSRGKEVGEPEPDYVRRLCEVMRVKRLYFSTEVNRLIDAFHAANQAERKKYQTEDHYQRMYDIAIMYQSLLSDAIAKDIAA